VPQDLRDTVSGFHGDPIEQAKLEAQTRANLEKYGAGNWYDFCVNEWGTKWDCGEQGASDIHPEGKLLHTSFDTAWAPPIAAYEKLEELGFTVKAMYYEPGMCFAGIWEDGNDECYQDWGDAQGAVDTLPAELDECFAISESQSEWEEEERMEEELYAFVKEGGEALEKKE
jgi:hypothetical protein